MRRLNRTVGALAFATLVLGACGGGSGAEPSAAPAPARSLVSITPPAGFDFASVRTTRALFSTELTSKASAGQFTNPAQSYVSIWYPDSHGDRQQLAFMSLKTMQALDAQGGVKLQVPTGINTLSFELYDKNSSLTGELRL